MKRLLFRVRFNLEQATKVQKWKRCISTLALNYALDGMGGQRHVPPILPPKHQLRIV
jgi:hypothetical protein